MSFTFMLPIAAGVITVAFFLCCPQLKTCSINNRTSVFSFKDYVSLLFICLIYAVIAFFSLGNTSSPQSFCHFTESGQYADISLESDIPVTKIRYFCGLNTGKYYIQYSEDGSAFYDAGNMSQSYSDIFKWKDAELTIPEGQTTKYIRIISDSDLYIGELAIYDESDTVLDSSRYSFASGACSLFDEQELVPTNINYLNSSYFDEVYHARTALENIQGISPYEISHPPLGKIILSLGMKIFGVTPFGWRFMGTLFGVLMLPALYVFLKKMFGGLSVPICGTTIFAFDFMHYVQTRIATIDTYAVFFIILMYLFMYLYVNSDRLKYLAFSGIFFGIGAACKWTCLYAGAGLGIIWLGHWVLKGQRFNFPAFIRNCMFCLVFFVIVPCCIYYASYYPYGYARGLNGVGMYFTKEYFDTVIQNQKYMLSYHIGVDAAHPYSSRWYQWILDIRPILYYLSYPAPEKVSSFGAWVNPVLCWSGLISIFAMAYLALFRHERKAAFILVAYLAQLVPWIFIKRTTFEYHYFACTVFLVLAVCYIFSTMRDNTLRWQIPVFGLTGICVTLFIMFYPALSGMTVPLAYSNNVLGWFSTWPF